MILQRDSVKLTVKISRVLNLLISVSLPRYSSHCNAIPKMGLASLLILKCSKGKCSFSHSYYTSAEVSNKQAFEVNKRAETKGVGNQGLVKFTCVMNMLPSMTENSYRDHVKALRGATKFVAEESMSRAANEVKEFQEPNKENLYDIAVSGDGTCRKRWFSSLYGVVTAMSTITGKALDCEVMSKECKQCVQWMGKEMYARRQTKPK